MMTLSDSCRVTLCLVPSRLWYGEEAPHSCLVAPVEVGMGEENKESTGTWKHTVWPDMGTPHQPTPFLPILCSSHSLTPSRSSF
ncbi:hypothetical protein Pcinc_003926 [Petrolisthes cinctipes]|uniref:Uncharacterized protein n=1 Tax=Petrolisthes cinctipes TaxID=88211 RepID=A0AAE1FJ83_PETCI|nr:hypothetical protein Pcinc_021758 [Petrolisthes cinctipes]KAK3875791.1 hypothetical protein Pcinc_019370 [Petrolisthes cinctipes]KAK3892222.1 hypothetical protein Pcinc_003926 [Petrolisthes cinctipes]